MNRLIQLDMLRGFALVCIMLDHMPVSLLRRGTLANYSVFDAAELFVLLSGFLVGLVWTVVEARDGRGQARRRFVRRAFQVWRALVLGGVIMALLSALLLWAGFAHTAIWNAYAGWVISQPLVYVAQLATLWLQPNLLDVLALYVVLIASVPLLVPLMLRAPLVFALGSVVMWWFAPQLNLYLPNHDGRGMLFNPFGWQMLFFSGVAMGLFRRSLMPRLLPWRRWLTLLASAMVLFGCTIIIALKIGEPALPLRQAMKSIYGEINKWSLDGTRYLAIMAASWLVAVPLETPLRRLAATPPGRALQEIGRGGLWSFVACVLLSVLGDALQQNPPGQGALRLLAVDLWTIVALWYLAAAWMRSTPRA